METSNSQDTTELPSAKALPPIELNDQDLAEAEPQAADDGFRQLVELSPDAIAIHRDGRILFVNPAGARLFGAADCQQLLGRSLSDFVQHDRLSNPAPVQPGTNPAGRPPPFVAQKLSRLDGTGRDVEVVDIPFTYRGQPAGQLIIRDISTRMQAETELKQRNRTLTVLQAAAAAISSSLDLRYVLDTVAEEMVKLLRVESCAIAEWDPAANLVFSVARYDSSGWWSPQALAGRFRPANYPLTKSVLEEQTPVQMTVDQLYVDPVELAYMQQAGLKSRVILPMIYQRRVVGLVELEDSRVERAFTFDELSLAQLLANQAASTIENARLYQTLHQRVTELTTLNEISHAITATLDLQEMLTIINGQITQVLGVAATSVALFDPARREYWFVAASGAGSDFIRDKRLPVEQGIVGSVIRSGEPQLVADVAHDPRFYNELDLENNFTTRSILCVPLHTKGKVIGAIEAINKQQGAFTEEDMRLLKSLARHAATAIENAQLFEQAQQEIEERQRAETALQEERALLAQRVEERTAELSRVNAELARAARLKDEFLANMSHELRTPLNVILGSTEILQTAVFGEINERQQKYLRNTDESGRHLLSLITDILDLSKIEAGRFELEVRPVSVREVCQASLRLVKQLAQKKNLNLIETLDQPEAILPADERRLKQILVNLLSNAIKFTPEGGEVGLEVKGDQTGQVLHFTVWDTGIGIAPEDLTDLFQPFIQADSSLARQHEGTGLGLSLVSRMTELHGGGVAVESEVGAGSHFTVSLPWPDRPEAVRPAEATPPDVAASLAGSATESWSGEQPQVLLAEDNERNITILSDYLESQGFRLTLARNGREAIDRALEARPDVILMDVQMPGMDGLTATRQLRNHVQTADIPVIAMTALAMAGDRERCLEAGATAYLSKPISPGELVQLIRHSLSQSRA